MVKAPTININFCGDLIKVQCYFLGYALNLENTFKSVKRVQYQYF